MVIESALHRRN